MSAIMHWLTVLECVLGVLVVVVGALYLLSSFYEDYLNDKSKEQ